MASVADMSDRTLFIITADLQRVSTRERHSVEFAFYRNERLRTPGIQEQDEVDREFDLRDALLGLYDQNDHLAPFRLRNAALIVKRGTHSRSVDPTKSFWTREFFGRSLDHAWRNPGSRTA
jgi:hypothetical protein